MYHNPPCGPNRISNYLRVGTPSQIACLCSSSYCAEALRTRIPIQDRRWICSLLKMSRRRLQVGVLSVCLATATAIGNDCTGASATLPPEECSAWIALYVSTGGPVWKSCSELRTNPCACPVVMCNGDPARPHIAELYVFLRCTSSLSDHDPSLFRAALRALTHHYLRHYQHAFSLSLSLRAHAATCATTT